MPSSSQPASRERARRAPGRRPSTAAPGFHGSRAACRVDDGRHRGRERARLLACSRVSATALTPRTPGPWRAITRRWISAAPPAMVLPALARVSAARRPSPMLPGPRSTSASGPSSRAPASAVRRTSVRDRQLRHRRLRRRPAGPPRAASPPAARAARAACASPRSRRSSSRAPAPLERLLQVVQHPQHHADLLARHALVVQRAHQHPPAAVQLADELLRGHLHVGQEHLAERAAADRLDLAHLDARACPCPPPAPRCRGAGGPRPGRFAPPGRSSRRSARSRSRACGRTRRSGRRRAAPWSAAPPGRSPPRAPRSPGRTPAGRPRSPGRSRSWSSSEACPSSTFPIVFTDSR